MGLKPACWSWLPGHRTGKTSENWRRKVMGLKLWFFKLEPWLPDYRRALDFIKLNRASQHPLICFPRCPHPDLSWSCNFDKAACIFPMKAGTRVLSPSNNTTAAISVSVKSQPPPLRGLIRPLLYDLGIDDLSRYIYVFNFEMEVTEPPQISCMWICLLFQRIENWQNLLA